MSKIKITVESPVAVSGENGPVVLLKVSDNPLPVAKVVTGLKGFKGDKGDPGIGDMQKSIYDLNNDGIVDNAEKLVGYTITNLPVNGGYF